MIKNKYKKYYDFIVYEDTDYLITLDHMREANEVLQVLLHSRDNDKMVGMLNTKVEYYKNKKFVKVVGVNINNRHRNRGYGTKMYKVLIDYCKKNNIQGLFSDITKQINKKEIPSIYKKFGGIYEDKYALIKFK